MKHKNVMILIVWITILFISINYLQIAFFMLLGIVFGGMIQRN